MTSPLSARPEIPAELLDRHRLFNRNSEGLWQTFAGHRANVDALLAPLVAAPGTRLCVLGAGNCNDLELPTLARAELHLVDLDDEAVGKGIARQGLAPSAVQVHAPLDVTGLMPRLKAFAQTAPAQLVADAATAATTAVSTLPGPFSVVVSACLLSQLMHTCRLALGAKHPALGQVGHALVVAHLRALAQLTAPGGTLVLVTDTASSQTYPLVELWDAQTPRALQDQLERSENVLSGTSSIYLRRQLNTDPVLRPLVARTRLVDPWLWQLGDDVTLMAYALVVTRVG
jgi:hypothetical protein